jgi:L-lactate utilization protein LutC
MEKIQKVNENLIKRGFKSCVVQTLDEAKNTALKIIGEGSVGIGGSVTVQQLGLYDSLTSQGNAVYWHWKDGGQVRYKAMTADYYICSANALTEDGCPILIDGNGNRIAALSFGPQNAILIIGKNKIVKDKEEGLNRIKSGECSGKNGVRLGLKTPCAVVGKCADCNSPQRMCSVTALFERPSGGLKNVYVLLVNQDLGY